MLEFTLLTYAVAFFVSAFFPDSNVLSYATACVIHESGHVLCARLLSVTADKPKAGLFTAIISLHSDKRIHNLLIALSGAFANLASSAVSLLIFGNAFYPFSLISFFLALLNLLPVSSLDGRVALECAFEAHISLGKRREILDALSDIILLSLSSVSAFRMLKYGDSLFSFLFSVRCIFVSKVRKRDEHRLNWNERISENSRV